VSLFVNFLRIPYRILYPTILMFCVVGVYAVNSSCVDVGIMTAMGALGYFLRKMGFEIAPIVLGVVLAPIIEFSFRQALAMSDLMRFSSSGRFQRLSCRCLDHDPSGPSLW
jgi:putative tricarboxylic transport membrane protein